MRTILFSSMLILSVNGFAQPISYKEDFTYFWQTVNDNYCYFEKKQVDWSNVRAIYSPQIDTVSSRESFVSILENCIYELYDHHCSLGTRNKFSRRLVPTGADVWAEFDGARAMITEVRKGSGAESAGLFAGVEVIAVNDVPVTSAIKPFLGHTVNNESKSFALRLLLAGDHLTPRKISARDQYGVRHFYPDNDGLWLEKVQYTSRVETAVLGEIGYIRINNFLFDNELIGDFDSCLNSMIKLRSMIIDLRETPSGGNSTVARAILGRFIDTEKFYQKHELYAEEKQTQVKRSWVEIASPRKETYQGNVVVIADHWTGSISEGITIAFDGMKRATVIGTPLARLNGAVESFEMPNTKIPFHISTERLFHINGTARETFTPNIEVQVTGQRPGKDVILAEAIEFLKKQMATK
jgi:C-terminal processing protease CtpA/Prc